MKSHTGRVIGIGIMVACGGAFAVASSFPPSPLANHYWGPAFFPKALSVLIAVLSLTMVFGRQDRDRVRQERTADEAAASASGKGLVWALVLLTMVYLLVMRTLGYLISTMAYTFASLWVLHPKKHVSLMWLVLGSIAFATGLYYVFGTVMNVMLPTGVLFRQ